VDERSASEHGAIQAIEGEAGALFGAAPTAVARLTHSRATRGVWRVAVAASKTAVVKVLVPPPPTTAAATDPHSLLYWLREACAYAAGAPAPYRAAGVRGPALLARLDRPNGDVALWLEDVQGAGAADWDLTQFETAAHRLGRAQGAYVAGAALPVDDWLCRGYLRQYLAVRKPEDDRLLTSDEAWRRPEIARHFPTDLRDDLRRLRADRENLLRWVEAAPQTFAHLDVWPDNLFDAGSELVLIDWGFAGIGSAGEDIGNLVPDSVFDLRHPAALLHDLDRTVFAGYLAGLREAGWSGDERLIRLAMTASACKYDWIAGATLARATAGDGAPVQSIYGGTEVDADRLFEARASALTLMVEWAAEARGLAAALGFEMTRPVR
jgi:hypothetical protein